ncbi:MAG: hypothetical protein HW414_670 [Dehalococcoidia bacterium]|nr:hypothetical protein [Dehalococcoidia bacterium]
MSTKTQPVSAWQPRAGAGFYVSAVILLVVLALGLYAYSRQLAEGEIVTGMRSIGTMGGATWGLYISFVVYFIGISFAGITIAALIRLLNLKTLAPLARAAELLTVISLILGALSIVIDLGQPLRGLKNLWLYARPASPFFYTFSLVIAGYLFASLVYLYLAGRADAAALATRGRGPVWLYRLWAAGYEGTAEERERHSRTLWWLALAIIPLLVLAHSTLGVVFGLQVGRPGWFSALQAPAFVILAGVSGIGMLVVIAAILRSVLRLQDRISLDQFKWLSNFLGFLLIAYLYLWGAEISTTAWVSRAEENELLRALISGEYAALFWVTVALLVIPFVILLLQFLTKRYSIPWIVTAGVMVNIAGMTKRYLLVVPSQTYGTLLPYAAGSYSPSWVEYLIILGLFALGILLYMLFVKVFPIVPIHETE